REAYHLGTMRGSKTISKKKKTSIPEAKTKVHKSYKAVKPLVEKYRQAGHRIVLAQGTWDMVHVGHARYLDSAKKYGDVLIVGVDEDKKVRYRKGPDRPVVPEDERLEMLTHLRCVDLVVLKKLSDPKWALIKTIRPDILITIEENYDDEQRMALREYCKQVVVMPRQATTSTSAKIRLLQINIAEKIGKALTPKVMSAIDEVFRELKGESTKKRK
ncbi:adenylyltransferase/cytidyltransferase family protein, partial [Candidatus Parcubacteria bacterium]|nr:adenylyltransferase/cytidyltransferase family protein [Candidatus Parcubacteria bacterium]